MGEALRRDAQARGVRRRALAFRLAILAAAAAAPAGADGQDLPPVRAEGGRFTIVANQSEAALARALLADARQRDSFPGLPRPRAHVLIAIAPDRRAFRAWAGAGAPEWGSAFALPAEQRVILQGRSAGSDAGNPADVLRHELAHLALHEAMGTLPPRWFDEGYASWAAAEWGRDETMATNVALALGGLPPLDSLDVGFEGGPRRADAAYALAYRAVAEMAELDRERGLAMLFAHWKRTGSLDQAVRAAYGLTLPAFETRWRERTRRRYGALAVVSDVTVGALVLLVLILPLVVIRRRRDRRRLAAMRAADLAADQRARAGALDELLRSVDAMRADTARDVQLPPPEG
jgi:hypothetical protein